MSDANTITHEEIKEIFPWFINGTLDEERRAVVSKHLEECAECAAQHKDLYFLGQAIKTMSSHISDVEGNLQKMLMRISTEDRIKIKKKNTWEKVRQIFEKKWIPIICAAQMLFVCALSVGIFTKSDGKQYHALANADIQKAKIAIVFRPATTVQRMQEILGSAGASIVDGPTVTLAYVVEVPLDESAVAQYQFEVAPEISVVQLLSRGGES